MLTNRAQSEIMQAKLEHFRYNPLFLENWAVLKKNNERKFRWPFVIVSNFRRARYPFSPVEGFFSRSIGSTLSGLEIESNFRWITSSKLNRESEWRKWVNLIENVDCINKPTGKETTRRERESFLAKRLQ